MALKTERRGGRLYLAALEPPGNVAADIARYRRLFFAASGGASRAFPELLPLAFARKAEPGRRIASKLSGRILGKAWLGIEGGFCSESVFTEGDLAYLGMEGPVEALVEAIGPILPRLGLEACPGPLALGAGFFLYRPASALASRAIPPPRCAFKDCRLCLYRIDLGEEPFVAQSWTELAAAPRPGRRA